MIFSKKHTLMAVLFYCCALSIQLLLSLYFSKKLSYNLLADIPDLRFLNSPQGVYDYFDNINEKGRLYYTYIAIYDSFYAMIYTSAGLILWRFLTQTITYQRFFDMTPVAFCCALLCDLLENMSYFLAATQFPVMTKWIYDLGILCTNAKLVSFFIFMVGLVIHLILFLRKKGKSFQDLGL